MSSPTDYESIQRHHAKTTYHDVYFHCTKHGQQGGLAVVRRYYFWNGYNWQFSHSREIVPCGFRT